jgi:hypothetical protein
MMVRSVRPEDLEMPLEGFSDFITPLDRFLVRTHVYIDLSEWRLRVDGHVETPLMMTLGAPRWQTRIALRCLIISLAATAKAPLTLSELQ